MVSCFTVNWSTRQGYNLSPVLFALFIETIAAEFHQCWEITEITMANTIPIKSVYMQMIYYYTYKNCHKITPCSALINRKIIFSLSLAVPKTGPNPPSFLYIINNNGRLQPQNYPFAGNIWLQGIDISNLPELFHLNFTLILKSIQEQLNSWNNLPLSLLSCIGTIKMSILPRINHLFSMIPI